MFLKETGPLAYAAVIPKFVMQLMQHQSPIINGDGITLAISPILIMLFK
jgi:hypothetical protein